MTSDFARTKSISIYSVKHARIDIVEEVRVELWENLFTFLRGKRWPKFKYKWEEVQTDTRVVVTLLAEIE